MAPVGVSWYQLDLENAFGNDLALLQIKVDLWWVMVGAERLRHRDEQVRLSRTTCLEAFVFSFSWNHDDRE